LLRCYAAAVSSLVAKAVPCAPRELGEEGEA
jgi:hypothetical protein